jgi:pyruvate,water dikinase
VNDVVWIRDLSRSDVAVAGGKGANLGELAQGGFPVPDGFVVTAGAYLAAMDGAGLRAKLAAADPSSVAELQDLVVHAGVRGALRTEVLDAYDRLGGGSVAVRSSATSEDAAGTSFAGMNRTFTDVEGDDALLEAIAACWGSLFTPRVLAYREAQAITTEPAIAVVVQRMLTPLRSGVMFTRDPASGEDRLVIEAAIGLGEVVVGGLVEVDTYEVAREPLRLVSVRVGEQAFALEHGERRALPPAVGSCRKLDDDQVLAIAELGVAVEAHYGEPQDTEWVVAEDGIHLVQSRPITTLPRDDIASSAALVTGLGAASGLAAGRVRVLRNPKEADAFTTGEVLVAPMTTPDWLPVLRRAAAIVTDAGGRTCHAAIVSRELGVPCIVVPGPRPLACGTATW